MQGLAISGRPRKPMRARLLALQRVATGGSAFGQHGAQSAFDA